MGFPIDRIDRDISSTSNASGESESESEGFGVVDDGHRGSAFARWIAVAGGCGYVPVAPGTAGSAAGALLFVALFGIGTSAGWMPSEWPTLGLGQFALFLSLTAFIIFLSGVGVWASGSAERDFCREGGCKDDGRIVIDEVVGQLIALTPLSILLTTDSSFFSMIVGVVTGFVLFRLFDVWKPGAIRWAERRFDGGLGVMADDLVAGVYAAAGLVAVLFVVETARPGIVLAGGYCLPFSLSLSLPFSLPLSRGLFSSRGLLSSRGLS